MKLIIRIAASVMALAPVTTPLGAQQRALVLRLYGGVVDHLADLSSSPAASFTPGYSVGASAGVQLSQLLAVRGDFTYTRNQTWGAASFAGADVNRFYYGVQLEARRTLGGNWTPSVFVGLGAVSVDQLGVDEFAPFTKAAVMVGGGVAYAIPGSRIAVFGELKGATYKWDQAGFDRTMFDVTYYVGASYRLPLRSSP